MSKEYSEMPEFNGIYLEDSFVISINENSDSLVFNIEGVLTEEHPEYHSPTNDEQYCYKNIRITFSNVKKVNWISKKLKSYTDANNEVDFGNIDEFTFDNSCYHLSGDWGEIEITSDEPVIT